MKPSRKKETKKPKHIRVVVADDSPFICRLLKQYLESDPFVKVIKTVLDGKQAMDAVVKLKPDVVTLDLDMPVLNGLEALEHKTSMLSLKIPAPRCESDWVTFKDGKEATMTIICCGTK